MKIFTFLSYSLSLIQSVWLALPTRWLNRGLLHTPSNSKHVAAKGSHCDLIANGQCVCVPFSRLHVSCLKITEPAQNIALCKERFHANCPNGFEKNLSFSAFVFEIRRTLLRYELGKLQNDQTYRVRISQLGTRINKENQNRRRIFC